MRYNMGSEAPLLEEYERGYAYDSSGALAFDVVEGGRLDGSVRQGIASDFMAYVRLVAIAVVTVLLLGTLRVVLTTMTVTQLQINLQTKAGIQHAMEVNSALRIERSVLSSTTRITRIATQNYGMVYAETHDHLDILSPERLAAEQHAQTLKDAQRAIDETTVSLSTGTANKVNVASAEDEDAAAQRTYYEETTVPTARTVARETSEP